MQRRVETLERSAEDLSLFKILARESYTTPSTKGLLKQPKESSGVTGVSPDTQRVRPPRKRLSTKTIQI